MTDDTKRLAEIRERVAKATRGPWDAFDGFTVVSYAQDLDEHYHRLPLMRKEMLGIEKPCEVIRIGNTNCTTGEGGQESRNAVFIAHARADIPWLLSQLAARDRQIAELEGALRGLECPKEKGRFCDHAAEPCPRCESARAALRDEGKGS